MWTLYKVNWALNVTWHYDSTSFSTTEVCNKSLEILFVLLLTNPTWPLHCGCSVPRGNDKSSDFPLTNTAKSPITLHCRSLDAAGLTPLAMPLRRVPDLRHEDEGIQDILPDYAKMKMVCSE